MKIYIVEDDREISKLLAGFLSEKGYEVKQAYDGREAEALFKREMPDVFLMDLMLPIKSGETLINEIRENSSTPIIVLSAKSMLETRLEVLRLGADDYILKPFNLEEVLVRIEVVLRRSQQDKSEDKVLTCGDLKLMAAENRVQYGDTNIALTSKELQLLKLFMQNPNKTFSKANLYEHVWDEEYCYEDNTINVHVSNLRSKLKKSTGCDYIETVWGIGYKLKEF